MLLRSDVNARSVEAAVPPGRGEGQDVRRFRAFSGDLCALADWLQRCEMVPDPRDPRTPGSDPRKVLVQRNKIAK